MFSILVTYMKFRKRNSYNFIVEIEFEVDNFILKELGHGSLDLSNNIHVSNRRVELWSLSLVGSTISSRSRSSSLSRGRRSSGNWVGLNLLDVSNDLLNLFVHVIPRIILFLLELFDTLEHFLHTVSNVQLLLSKLTLQSTQCVGKIFNVSPGPIGFSLLYLWYDILVVWEILIVQLTVVSKQETGKV
jgi:hypothetical protein